jgi:CelD/BcsL family acetyltransferase involved in cellulose biosynthesis
MSARLMTAGKRRLTFARLEGEDVAYIFGGVFGDTYRGLQFSFDSQLTKFSLGNLCQFETIQRLAREGVARYDLGTEVRYKRRWGETVESTTALIAQRMS